MHTALHSVADSDFDCPLLDSQRRPICRATPTLTSPDERRRRVFCLNDNHDNCPFYLSYLLKRSRPNSRHSRHNEFSQK
jgi:hypothetical protein